MIGGCRIETPPENYGHRVLIYGKGSANPGPSSPLVTTSAALQVVPFAVPETRKAHTRSQIAVLARHGAGAPTIPYARESTANIRTIP